MIAIRQRLLRTAQDEGAFTLVEVVVAMFVFTIMSIGVLYTMISILSVTRDSRNREVATNLAAQEIDLARDVNDIFKIDTIDPKNIQLNGETFTVTREQEWVYSNGEAAACGTGIGAMRYKLVQVGVTWLNMRGEGVKSETFINPNERINAIDKGSLIVSVTTAVGDGVENATVIATPSSGTTLTKSTDSDGCAFFIGVTPAAFTVKIQAPPATTYVDITGATEPTKTATVVAATSASVPFTFDPAGTLRATYVAAGTLIPLNMSTTLLSTRDPVSTAATTAANPRSFLVSPWADGYAVVAGNAAACDAMDPGLWTASGAFGDGERPEPVTALSGTTTDVTVPMGTLTVTGMSTSGSNTNRYLVAVSRNAAQLTGQPTCGIPASPQILRFAQTSVATMNIALPYGSWDIYKGTTSSFTPTSGTKITSGMTAGTGASISSGIVTFDPRGPA